MLSKKSKYAIKALLALAKVYEEKTPFSYKRFFVYLY